MSMRCNVKIFTKWLEMEGLSKQNVSVVHKWLKLPQNYFSFNQNLMGISLLLFYIDKQMNRLKIAESFVGKRSNIKKSPVWKNLALSVHSIPINK